LIIQCTFRSLAEVLGPKSTSASALAQVVIVGEPNENL